MTSNGGDAERVPGETPDRREAFPRLTADQHDVLQTCGQRRTAEVGDFLYRAGERVNEVLAVLSGRVAIVQSDPDADHIVEVHGPGRVLGELGMLEGQSALFSAKMVEAGQIVAVPNAHLSDVAFRDSVLGETILRAYLIRRARLIERGAGMGIIGSSYAPDTRRLLDFAARTACPTSGLIWKKNRMSTPSCDD